MVEAENYSRTKTPLEVQLIPILGQEFQPCIQYNFLSTGVISMHYVDEMGVCYVQETLNHLVRGGEGGSF